MSETSKSEEYRIEQWAWDKAIETIASGPFIFTTKEDYTEAQKCIAKALMDAKAEQIEADALIARGAYRTFEEYAGTALEVSCDVTACIAIGTAIRKGGE